MRLAAITLAQAPVGDPSDYQRGMAALGRKNYSAAVAALGAALAKRPDDTKARTDLSDACVDRGAALVRIGQPARRCRTCKALQMRPSWHKDFSAAFRIDERAGGPSR